MSILSYCVVQKPSLKPLTVLTVQQGCNACLNWSDCLTIQYEFFLFDYLYGKYFPDIPIKTVDLKIGSGTLEI